MKLTCLFCRFSTRLAWRWRRHNTRTSCAFVEGAGPAWSESST